MAEEIFWVLVVVLVIALIDFIINHIVLFLIIAAAGGGLYFYIKHSKEQAALEERNAEERKKREEALKKKQEAFRGTYDSFLSGGLTEDKLDTVAKIIQDAPRYSDEDVTKDYAIGIFHKHLPGIMERFMTNMKNKDFQQASKDLKLMEVLSKDRDEHDQLEKLKAYYTDAISFYR